ncbi:MAG: class I SAM-dependent methyltransferase [bacterium]
MDELALRPTRCAICGTEGNATQIYPANFNPRDLNPSVFSARRLPDRIHYRIVKCRACGLVRSDPVADSALLDKLYAQSTFDYEPEVSNLRATYGRYLGMLDHHRVKKDSLLEIGCGNGFFLEEALARGYREVRGVEPSEAAVASADPAVRSRIVCNTMKAGLFPSESFDVICMFQAFDHIPDPVALLRECCHVLRPGGLALLLNHNMNAFSARLLGERSPIIDIEHTFLYTPATMTQMISSQGLQVRRVGSVLNRYTLSYLFHLAPLSGGLKNLVLDLLKRTKVGKLPLWAPLGNLYVIAQKPHAAGGD